MLTHEKVLKVFGPYLDADPDYEVVKTSRGYTLLAWNNRREEWFSAEFCKTPESLRDALLDAYVNYLEYVVTDEDRDPTEQEMREIQKKRQAMYVRVAGTTRLADEYMIKELMFEGSNRYFDQALCTGLNVTDEDIDALCNAMKKQAIKNAHNEEQKAAVKDVGRQQLRSWGVLIERDGKDYPSNAYAILTGCGGLHVATQCGVFKGTTKEVFVDRREYTGPIWEQIEEAFQFVLRNIHLGAAIVGIYRQDVYEIPPDAIRELIINAAVHRSYLDHGNIQVAVYDNRLEITSPGKLPMDKLWSV